MKAVKSLSGIIYKYLEDIQIFLVNSRLDPVISFPPHYSDHLPYHLTICCMILIWVKHLKTLTQLAKIKVCRAVIALTFWIFRSLLACIWSLSLGSLCFWFFIKQLGSQTLEQNYVGLLGDKWSWKKNTIKKWTIKKHGVLRGEFKQVLYIPQNHCYLTYISSMLQRSKEMDNRKCGKLWVSLQRISTFGLDNNKKRNNKTS